MSSNQTDFPDKVSSSRYPEGFYRERLKGASLYYENTVSVKPLNERKREWIELCTDEKSQALEWSELSSKNSAYYRNLVGEKETEKYFEFKRVYSKNPRDVILSRVHKCAYLDRSQFDKFNKGTVLGIYNQRPITVENVKELVEYLWFIENYNTGGQVINTFTESDSASISHTIYVFAEGGNGIRLITSEHTVSRSTGEIILSQENVKIV